MERNINRLSEGLVRYIARVFGIDIIEKSFSIFRSVHFPGHEKSSKLSPIVHVNTRIESIFRPRFGSNFMEIGRVRYPNGTFPGNHPLVQGLLGLFLKLHFNLPLGIFLFLYMEHI